MAAVSRAFELDISKLKQFHATHFAAQPVPDISSASAQKGQRQVQEVEEKESESYDDGLGYYDDGVKRTLTEDQVKMFRHSEIERLLAARRRDAEVRDDERSALRNAEEERNDKHQARANIDDLSSSNMAQARGLPAKSKRKAHFDEPQDEDAEVMLDY